MSTLVYKLFRDFNSNFTQTSEIWIRFWIKDHHIEEAQREIIKAPMLKEKDFNIKHNYQNLRKYISNVTKKPFASQTNYILPAFSEQLVPDSKWFGIITAQKAFWPKIKLNSGRGST